MPNLASLGYGASLSVNTGSGSPPAQVPFIQVKSITLPAQENQYVDASYLGMATTTKEYIAGLREPTDMNFVLHYTPDELARCYSLQSVTKTYICTFADGATATWDGIMSKAEVTVTVDAIIEISATVRVTGAMVFVP